MKIDDFSALAVPGVRRLANYGLPQHLRLTVGAKQQNQRVLDALTEILETT